MSAIRERDIQQPVIEWARKRGCRVIRLTVRGGVSAGWPDCVFLPAGGVPVFIEFKAPGKKPTELQKERLRYLEGFGYVAYVFDDADKAKESLAGHGV